jgi:hypothetical protein
MLVTFSCREYGNITLFGEVATRLLKMMGHSATVPGAIMADEVPAALHSLQDNINHIKPMNTPDDEDGEPQISLATRAVPLINLLKAASQKNCNVMWK